MDLAEVFNGTEITTNAIETVSNSAAQVFMNDFLGDKKSLISSEVEKRRFENFGEYNSWFMIYETAKVHMF